MGLGKLFLGAAAAPATVPLMFAASAFGHAKQRNIPALLGHTAIAWTMLTGGNHFIANPNANMADSINQTLHPNAMQMAKDVGVATKKWTGGAISASGTALSFGWSFATGVYDGVDNQIQANRTPSRAVPHKPSGP